MSAFDNMLADMLKKAIPPEIAELLTPEKLSEFGDKINAYIVDTRDRLTRIEETQAIILERLENVGNNNSTPKRGSGSKSGNGTGSGNSGSSGGCN